MLLSLRYKHILVPFEHRVVLNEKKCEGIDMGEESLNVGMGLYLSLGFFPLKLAVQGSQWHN